MVEQFSRLSSLLLRHLGVPPLCPLQYESHFWQCITHSLWNICQKNASQACTLCLLLGVCYIQWVSLSINIALHPEVAQAFLHGFSELPTSKLTELTYVYEIIFSPMCIYMCVHEYEHTCARVHMWKSEDNLGHRALLSSSVLLTAAFTKLTDGYSRILLSFQPHRSTGITKAW